MVDFINRALELALEIQGVSGPKLVDWKKVLTTDDKFKKQVSDLKAEVETFAAQYPMPGNALY